MALGWSQVTWGRREFCGSKIWLHLPLPEIGPGTTSGGSTKYRWLAAGLADSFALSCLWNVRACADPTAQHVHLPKSKDGAAYRLHFDSLAMSWTEETPRASKREGCGTQGLHPASASGAPALSMTADLRVPVTQYHALRGVTFKPLSPCRKQKSASLHQPFCGAWMSQQYNRY